MPVSVEKLAGEPIIVVTIKGHLDAEMMRAIYAEVAELSQGIAPPVYHITDVREMDVTLADMVEILKEASRGVAGSATDSRVANVFVGRSPMSRFAADMLRLRRFGGVSTVLLSTLDDALAYVRLKTATTSQRPSPVK